MSYRWTHRSGANGVPYLVDGKAAVLDAGTNGHVLTLSGGDPVWAAASGGGSDPWTNVILGSDFAHSTDFGAWIQAPSSATASAQRWFGPATTQNAASTGLPDISSSWMAIGGAMLVMGAAPSGVFQVTIASEVGASAVTVKAGSSIRYREIA